MGYSYKSYSDTKEVFKKFVNAAEGQAVYGISRSHIMEMAKKAGAVYKVGNTALINTEIFEAYLEQFKENPVPLPKYIVDKTKIKTPVFGVILRKYTKPVHIQIFSSGL